PWVKPRSHGRQSRRGQTVSALTSSLVLCQSATLPGYNRIFLIFDSRKRGREGQGVVGACRSRTNADDRLPLDPRGRVECGDGVLKGRAVADVRPPPSVPHPLDDRTQLG